jgi:uncharacterized membrane protein
MTQSVFSLVKKKIRALTSLKSEQFEQFFGRRFFRIDAGLFFVLLFIVVYAMVFSYFTVLKHNVFRSYAWDLGINNQAFWTTLNEGKLFYCTPELFFNPSGSYFGLHFSPIMFLVLPVYAINQAPETLLVFQSFLLAIGALPLYLLARDGTKSKLIGVTFSLIYLLYPILHGVNWFDFHVQAFLPVVFFSAIYFLMHEKWLKFYFFIFLSLTIAENVSFVVLFIGFYTIWLYRKSLLQAIKQRAIIDRRILVPPLTIGMAILWFLAVRWIQNIFFPLNPNFSQFYRAVNYYSVLGVENDPVLLPLYLILNPLKALEALAYDAYLKLAFVLLLFGGLLFLPLRSSMSFITLAWLGPALLSNYQPYYMMGDHYPAYVIPFVFAAAVYAIGKYRAKGLPLSKLGSQARNLLILGVLFSLLASPISPLLGTTNVLVPYFSEYGAPVPTEHTATLSEIIQLIPSNASVLTQNNLFPHFSSRANAYVLPLPDAVEFAPFAMNSYVYRLLNESEYVLIDQKTDEYEARELVFSRIGTLNFGVLAVKDGIYLFEKNYGGEPIS